jgi:hypothetical protein
MKRLITSLDVVLPMLGVLVIVAALLPDLSSQALGSILLGALLIQAGMSKMSRRFLPEERQFQALRAEGELFLSLMRALNATAIELREHDTPESRHELAQVREAMSRSVERMAEVAGKAVKQASHEAGEPNSVVMWKNDFFGSPD